MGKETYTSYISFLSINVTFYVDENILGLLHGFGPGKDAYQNAFAYSSKRGQPIFLFAWRALYAHKTNRTQNRGSEVVSDIIPKSYSS